MNDRQLEELLRRASNNTLREEDTELMQNIFESYTRFFEIVRDKNSSIARLRKLMFGASTEKTETVIGKTGGFTGATVDDHRPQEPPGGEGGRERPDNGCPENKSEQPPPGHGRLGADDYGGGRQVNVGHPTLAAGDACPACDQGTLYQKKPGVLVRFVGQAPRQATVYRMQKLRCHLCCKVFTAPAPQGIGDQKYDCTAASMIGLSKYGSGLPFNRLDRLQGNLEIPLPASTQWDIVHAAAESLTPAYKALIRQAAQGEVVYNDDTTVRILELMGRRARKNPLDSDLDPSRTGLFTCNYKFVGPRPSLEA